MFIVDEVLGADSSVGIDAEDLQNAFEFVRR